MFNNVSIIIILGVVSLGLLVYGLFKHEERLQEMERQLTANQEKFINKKG